MALHECGVLGGLLLVPSRLAPGYAPSPPPALVPVGRSPSTTPTAVGGSLRAIPLETCRSTTKSRLQAFSDSIGKGNFRERAVAESFGDPRHRRGVPRLSAERFQKRLTSDAVPVAKAVGNRLFECLQGAPLLVSAGFGDGEAVPPFGVCRAQQHRQFPQACSLRILVGGQ